MNSGNGRGNQAGAGARSMRVEARDPHAEATVHPAWASFIRLCQQIEFGELERVKLQDGVPVLVEVVKKKVKLAQ